MSFTSERRAFPQKWNACAQGDGGLDRRKPEKHREGFWNSEKRDHRSACRRDPDIAREPLGKREPVMSSLRSRKSRRRWGGADLRVVAVLHVHSLGAQELDAGPSIPPATPITP